MKAMNAAFFVFLLLFFSAKERFWGLRSYLQRFVVREQALDYRDFAVQLPGIASRRGSWPGYYRGSAVYKTGSAKQGIQIIESYLQR